MQHRHQHSKQTRRATLHTVVAGVLVAAAVLSQLCTVAVAECIKFGSFELKGSGKTCSIDAAKTQATSGCLERLDSLKQSYPKVSVCRCPGSKETVAVDGFEPKYSGSGSSCTFRADYYCCLDYGTSAASSPKAASAPREPRAAPLPALSYQPAERPSQQTGPDFLGRAPAEPTPVPARKAAPKSTPVPAEKPEPAPAPAEPTPVPARRAVPKSTPAPAEKPAASPASGGGGLGSGLGNLLTGMTDGLGGITTAIGRTATGGLINFGSGGSGGSDGGAVGGTATSSTGGTAGTNLLGGLFGGGRSPATSGASGTGNLLGGLNVLGGGGAQPVSIPVFGGRRLQDAR